MALTFVALSEARAHEDTLIRLNGTELVGLPANYAPAELDMKAFRLRIGKRELTFPPSVRELFEQPHDLRISASWYHSSATLPPYMLLHIQPRKKDFSYEVLLDLDTLQMIDFTLVLRISDKETWNLGINRTDQWKKEIKDSIQTRK
jgi:hypothetical protein